MCFTWFEIFNNYLNENCINFLYIWKYNISFFKFNLYIFNNKFYCFILVYLVWIFHFWWVSGNLICTRTWFLNIYLYTMDYFKYVIYNIYNFDTVTFYFYVFLLIYLLVGLYLLIPPFMVVYTTVIFRKHGF